MNSKLIKYKGSYTEKCNRTTEIQRQKPLKPKTKIILVQKNNNDRGNNENQKIVGKTIKYGKEIIANLAYCTQKTRQWNVKSNTLCNSFKNVKYLGTIKKEYKASTQKEKLKSSYKNKRQDLNKRLKIVNVPVLPKLTFRFNAIPTYRTKAIFKKL